MIGLESVYGVLVLVPGLLPKLGLGATALVEIITTLHQHADRRVLGLGVTSWL